MSPLDAKPSHGAVAREGARRGIQAVAWRLRSLAFAAPVLVAMSFPAVAQDCPSCARLAEIAAQAGIDPGAAPGRLAETAPVVLRLKSARCGDLPEVSFVMQEIGNLEARAFARAESLAQMPQKCPAWRSTVRNNPARLCEARLALELAGRDLAAAGDAFARAAALFDAAQARAQLPEEVLNAQLVLEGNAALDLLRRGASALSGNGAELPEHSAWALVATGIADIGEIVRALVDVRLANEDALRLARVLIAAGTALEERGGSGGPGESLAPEDRIAAQRKMLDLAADILWAMDSAALSAERARRAYDAATGPDPTANAMPRSPAAATGELATCLERAALSLSLSAEAQRMMLDLLPQAAGPSCPALKPAPPQGLSAVFHRDLKYEKAMTDLQRCPAPSDGN